MRIGIKASAPPDSAPYTFRIKPVEHGQVAPRESEKKKEKKTE